MGLHVYMYTCTFEFSENEEHSETCFVQYVHVVV